MSVFSNPNFAGHEEVVFASDPGADLQAIIAVHSTALGPAIGGCRVWKYEDDAVAMTDVLRLSRGMSYKAAMANVPFGGGKSVVILKHGQVKSPVLMQALGQAIRRMNGRYVTGEDVGTNADDMRVIRQVTDSVMGLPKEHGGSGDPSPMTALGCFSGIQASVQHKLGHGDLKGIRVAVQGLGNVGMNLCKLLHEAGARLTVSDIVEDHVRLASEKFRAAVLPPDAIYDAEAEVLAPCALGAIINPQTIPRLKVQIVAGGANNQLATSEDGTTLHSRGILYAPDYVINAGGMIQLAMERLSRPLHQVEELVSAIKDRLSGLYQSAAATNEATHLAADRLAEQRIAKAARQAA